MKCSNCGAEVPCPETGSVPKGSMTGAMIATIVIVVCIIAATFYSVSALKPRPVLVGDLDTYDVDWDGDDGYLMLGVAGNIYNEGSVGCFANVTCELSDSRGWTWEFTVDLGWMGVSDIRHVYSSYEFPLNFNGVTVTGPMHEDMTIHLEFSFYDPTSDNRSQCSTGIA